MNTNNRMGGGNLKQIGFWAAVIIGIGLVVAGLIWVVSLQNKRTDEGTVTIDNVITSDDLVKGNRNASTTLIEYGDFQCPACGYFSPLVNRLSADFGDKLAVVFRHFPLPQHANAIPMVYASEAAARQGKFWEMHGMIYLNQTKWENEPDITNTVSGYAKSLGLNVDQFLKDFTSADLRKIADEKIKKNQDMNVITYTPTFFLNGTRITPPTTYEDLKAVIQKSIDGNK